MSPKPACRAVTTTFISGLAIAVFCVTSCVTVSPHQFSEPTAGWKPKTGQLMYRSPKTTLISDALVRFSKMGDFEKRTSASEISVVLGLRYISWPVLGFHPAVGSEN